MSVTSESTVREMANYGGFVDAFGGAATVVLAVIALSGTTPDILLGIATIVFGAALLIQSGTILSELGTAMTPAEASGASGLSMVFLSATAGIVLGVLALIGIHPALLTSIAVIAYGAALVFGSNAVAGVFRAKQAIYRVGGRRMFSNAEIVMNEVASGSAGLQFLGGIAAIVLGILAVTGTAQAVLGLVALLVMGATLLLTGSTLTSMAQSFSGTTTTVERWSGSPAE